MQKHVKEFRRYHQKTDAHPVDSGNATRAERREIRALRRDRYAQLFCGSSARSSA